MFPRSKDVYNKLSTIPYMIEKEIHMIHIRKETITTTITIEQLIMTTI